MALPPISTGMLLVFGLIAVALVLFITELIPSDITALSVLVALVVLEPWTQLTAREAISGFASTATITIVAMYMLSEGIQRTGLVERLGAYLAKLTRGSEKRLLGATIGSTGAAAGFVNNTPIVAVFIPMITGLAEESKISPSKLLLPLSYAAMLGGTLTLIGTSTNLLASDFARQIPGRGPIGMFEFTKLGVIVFLVGALYLLTVGRRLIPARIDPTADFTEEFDLDNHLTRLVVKEGSSLVGMRPEDASAELDLGPEVDLDLLQFERDEESYLAAGSDRALQPGDVLTVRANREDARDVADRFQLRHLPRANVTESALVEEGDGTLVEVVILPDSRLVGETIGETRLDEHFDTTALAVRRGDETTQQQLDDWEIGAGDTLLLQTTDEAIEFLVEHGDVVVTETAEETTARADESPEDATPLSPKTPIAVGIMVAVIGMAALGVLPIVIAALGGVVAMVVTGCLKPNDAYDAVSWNIIFLLAGVIPLGMAMQRTGGAEFLAALLEGSAAFLPLIAVLALFYLLTGLLSNIITPVASVVLMIPIAIDTAGRLGANEFTFLLSVMFAASAAFMTPIGYQTNLMVYGPGGYKFTDYLRVGGPLQLLLMVVTTLGLAFFWGLT